ncbi:S-layer homology domain-containing protein [Bacillus infantis]|uniref:S-layer homology domain-containing protein n=1 Tax=Bacillus infantis TaxID=324767 RepID=UPI002003E509|nr:S-layer homology domain-containing protein [Bacillus infantis]MCK6207139.1 S-layer homology domain-containing protein [Bacillus infantis]
MKKYIVLFLLIIFFTMHEKDVLAKEFTDVPKSHLYYDEIDYLSDLGIINGYQDGKFKPESFITNRQVSSMIVRLLDAHDLPYKDVDQTFIDLSKKDSAYKEMAISLELGLMRYKYGTTFDLSTGKVLAQGWRFFPNEYITREDMAFTLASALFVTGNENISFADTKKASLNEPEISVLADNKIVTGYSKDEFRPKQPITRAHFSVLLYRALQTLEKQDKNQLEELALHEAASPLASYITAGSHAGSRGSAYDFSYGNGRYAILSSNSSSVRFLDMNTLKTTPDWATGSIVGIQGDLAVWIEDRNGPLNFVDLSAKAKKVQRVKLPKMEVDDISFSDDGQYLFLKNSHDTELLPQQIYDIKKKNFTEIPYYEVSMSDWENGELYFWGMSDFDYLEKTEDGYSITNMVKGLYAYNPITNVSRTVYEESLDTLGYASYTTPFSFHASKDLGVLNTDFGIYLISLQNGKMTQILSHQEGLTSSFTPVTILDRHLYYVEGNNIVKHSIDTMKKDKIYTFKNSPDPEGITLSIKGNLLIAHGPGAPMTMIRIQ